MSAPAGVELIPSHPAEVGGMTVRRSLPRRPHRTVGSWCFLDHMGPVSAAAGPGMSIGPHPHMGLHTVTWLVAGEILHRDSLGSEQLIRPGQLNLMTAGAGVSHAEETTSAYRGEMHGAQLWVAQPEATRHGPAAFEHHAELPQVDLASGTATVLVGSLGGAASPARRDTDNVGADLDLRAGTSVVELDASYEYALVVLVGQLLVGGVMVAPDTLAYLGTGRRELAVSAQAPARALLLGGVPFPDPVVMWWNFVGRTRDEMTAAYRSWAADDGRFGAVASTMDRIAAPRPVWLPG